MTESDKRLADAFISAVKEGLYLPSYVTSVIEDKSKYGLSQEAKDYIYENIEGI